MTPGMVGLLLLMPDLLQRTCSNGHFPHQRREPGSQALEKLVVAEPEYQCLFAEAAFLANRGPPRI